MVSGLRALFSFIFTLFLLIVSLGAFHQTHTYTSTVAPHSDLTRFLGTLCPVLSILTYISPIASAVECVRKWDVTHFPIQVVFAQAAQNVASAAYGLHIDNDPFLISSGVGLVFQLIWITVWFAVMKRDSNSPTIRGMHPITASLLVGSAIILAVILLTWTSRKLVGSLSCGLTLLLCISPLSKLGLVVRSMNSASIPIAMSVVMLITNIAWAVYGLLLEDVFVFLPSLFGFVITVFQILVSAWCNGYLFYDLTFLKWLYLGYESVTPVESVAHSNDVTFGLEEDRRIS
jgi:solute carrier family 50 protein (sugar transporter)